MHIFLILCLLLTGCSHKQYLPVDNPESPPPFFVPEKIRVAVVLGSGGVRGMAHVGVLEEFEKEGIPIDLIVGCSAGGLVGALYADNPNSQEIKDAVMRIQTNSFFDMNLWHCRYGLSQGQTLTRVLCDNLKAQNFDELQIPFVVVATDLNSGELVPFGSGNVVDAVIASCSIPVLYTPKEYMGRVLIDGGIINPVPVKVARDLGADIVIAIDLCELLPHTFPSSLFGVAKRSAEIAFMWQNERCTMNADVIIRPKTCGVGTFNDQKKMHIYEAGRVAAREKMPLIKEVLRNKLESCTYAPKERLICLPCYTPEICFEPY